MPVLNILFLEIKIKNILSCFQHGTTATLTAGKLPSCAPTAQYSHKASRPAIGGSTCVARCRPHYIRSTPGCTGAEGNNRDPSPIG